MMTNRMVIKIKIVIIMISNNNGVHFKILKLHISISNSRVNNKVVNHMEININNIIKTVTAIIKVEVTIIILVMQKILTIINKEVIIIINNKIESHSNSSKINYNNIKMIKRKMAKKINPPTRYPINNKYIIETESCNRAVNNKKEILSYKIIIMIPLIIMTFQNLIMIINVRSILIHKAIKAKIMIISPLNIFEKIARKIKLRYKKISSLIVNKTRVPITLNLLYIYSRTRQKN